MVVRIPIDEFKIRTSEILERVWRDRKTIEVEVDRGKVVSLHPTADTAEMTQEDYEAFMSSFGSWSDLDAEQFLKGVYGSRDRLRSES